VSARDSCRMRMNSVRAGQWVRYHSGGGHTAKSQK
jgi:hypothetical protein